MFVIIVQKRQVAVAVPAEGYHLSVSLKHERIVVRADIGNADLEELALGDGRTCLPGYEQVLVLTRLKYLQTGTHHPEASELKLLLAALAQF